MWRKDLRELNLGINEINLGNCILSNSFEFTN